MISPEDKAAGWKELTLPSRISRTEARDIAIIIRHYYPVYEMGGTIAFRVLNSKGNQVGYRITYQESVGNGAKVEGTAERCTLPVDTGSKRP